MYGPALSFRERYRVQLVQNSCARFVFRLRKFDHISSKIKDLNWLRTDSRVQLQLGCFLFKVLKSDCNPLKKMFVPRSSVHSRNTRNRHHFSLPKIHLSLYKRSWLYKSIKLFNSFSPLFRSSSLNTFKSSYSRTLLNK